MRKYALTKLGPGDYVCPDNDGDTLWRFTSYEDGRCAGLDVDFDRRTFWRVQRVPMRLLDLDEAPWEEFDCGYRTRRLAVESVFGADA